MTAAATQAAALFTLRKNRRSRVAAQALPLHAAGIVISGPGLYVQDDYGNGLAWVSLGAGTTGPGVLEGDATVINDGGVSWAQIFRPTFSSPTYTITHGETTMAIKVSRSGHGQCARNRNVEKQTPDKARSARRGESTCARRQPNRMARTAA